MKHFRTEEFVSRQDYLAHGERCLELMDSRILSVADKLRDRYGPLSINTWVFGGSFNLSGLRPLGDTIGAKYSQHRFGRAIDAKFRDITVQEVYADILAVQEKWPEITVMENIATTPTWLHIDCRRHTRNGIWIVNP